MKQKIIGLFICISFFSFLSVKLKEKKVLMGKLSVLLPETFRLMNIQEIKSKYPNGNPPTEVYTSTDLSANIGFNYTSNQLKDDQVIQAFPQIVKQFETLYPSAKWYRKEVAKINGKNFIFIELMIPSIGSNYYNFMSFTSVNDRLLISSFNCPASKQLEWNTTAYNIMKSIVVL